MAVSPSSSVRQAREALAQRLRDIRIEAGLSARAIAQAAGWHESECSRIEHARTPPSADDIRAWCAACGAEGEIPDLLASLRAADTAYAEWRRLQVTGLKHLQHSCSTGSGYPRRRGRAARPGCRTGSGSRSMRKMARRF